MCAYAENIVQHILPLDKELSEQLRDEAHHCLGGSKRYGLATYLRILITTHPLRRLVRAIDHEDDAASVIMAWIALKPVLQHGVQTTQDLATVEAAAKKYMMKRRSWHARGPLSVKPDRSRSGRKSTGPLDQRQETEK